MLCYDRGYGLLDSNSRSPILFFDFVARLGASNSDVSTSSLYWRTVMTATFLKLVLRYYHTSYLRQYSSVQKEKQCRVMSTFCQASLRRGLLGGAESNQLGGETSSTRLKAVLESRE